MRSFSVDEHVLLREIRQRTAASHTQDTGCETYRWRFYGIVMFPCVICLKGAVVRVW